MSKKTHFSILKTHIFLLPLHSYLNVLPDNAALLHGTSQSDMKREA